MDAFYFWICHTHTQIAMNRTDSTHLVLWNVTVPRTPLTPGADVLPNFHLSKYPNAKTTQQTIPKCFISLSPSASGSLLKSNLHHTTAMSHCRQTHLQLSPRRQPHIFAMIFHHRVLHHVLPIINKHKTRSHIWKLKNFNFSTAQFILHITIVTVWVTTTMLCLVLQWRSSRSKWIIFKLTLATAGK